MTPRPHPPPGEGTAATSALLALADPATVGPLAQAMQRIGLVSMLAFDANQVRARLRDQPLDIAVVLLDTRLNKGRTAELVTVIRDHTQASILTLHPGNNRVGSERPRESESPESPENPEGADTLPLDAPAESIAARAQALARAYLRNRVAPVLRWGELRLDPAARTAYIGPTPLPLTPSQFAVLGTLIDAAGAVVGVEQIANAIYGRGHPLDSPRVRAHMVRLRRALRAVRPQTADLVVTVRSEGYRLMPPEPARAPGDGTRQTDRNSPRHPSPR